MNTAITLDRNGTDTNRIPADLPRPLEAAMASLKTVIDEADTKTTELQQRLTDLLRPETTGVCPSSTEEKQPQQSPLIEILNSKTYHLKLITTKLQDLLTRLEI